MSSTTSKSLFSAFHHNLPGLVIGSYFISLQFVQSIDLSFLILLVGLLFLFFTHPVVHCRSLIGGATAVAAALFLSTLFSSSVVGRDFVGRTMPLAQIPGLLIFFVFVLFIRKRSQIAPIVWSFFLGLSICVWQFLLASYTAGFERSGALIFLTAHPLYLAPNDVLMFAVFFPVIIWYGRYLKGGWGLLLAIGYSILLIFLAELLLSRIALLAVAATLLLPLLQVKRWKILLGSLLAAALAICVIAYYDPLLLSKLQIHNLDRVRLWMIAWHMFMDAPWLGHGPGSFSALYTDYLDRLGPTVNYGNDVRHMGWAHNWFLESASEKGVIGLGAVLAYFAYIFTVIINNLKHGGDYFYRALGLSAILLLVAANAELSFLRIWAIYVVYLMLGLVAVFRHPRVGELE